VEEVLESLVLRIKQPEAMRILKWQSQGKEKPGRS
jgi:hypothetical protein